MKGQEKVGKRSGIFSDGKIGKVGERKQKGGGSWGFSFIYFTFFSFKGV
jgi:hypothetical protein